MHSVHPSNRSGTVLCSVVMVNWGNLSCQTRDYDDDDGSSAAIPFTQMLSNEALTNSDVSPLQMGRSIGFLTTVLFEISNIK